MMAATFQIIFGGAVVASENTAVIQQSNKKHITGIVKDNAGFPVPGATVMIPNSNVGTITNVDGSYAIDVPEGTTALEVVCMGYTTVNLALGAASVYDVTLKEDTLALEEVVVVGYGTQKKVNLTGAVSTVNFEDMVDHLTGGIL